MHKRQASMRRRVTFSFAFFVVAITTTIFSTTALPAYAAGTVNAAINQAAQEFGVPAPVLKALCYMEGRLSNHGGNPSIDGGYGCMHLVQNRRADTLAQAAHDLSVDQQTLKTDIATNIRGGAAVLRDYAGQGTSPVSLADWYRVIAAYSNATTRDTALMYADHLYGLLKTGFAATTERGEAVTLAPVAVTPNIAGAASVKGRGALPTGCMSGTTGDYPGAVNCIVDPQTYDCNVTATNAPCTYEDANRPTDFPVLFVVIHDIEGTAQDALNVFQDVNSSVSVHYIVDSDGTVYQVIHDKDIAYHAGNYWYNQRSVGIEHAGFDATGFQWYNATEYLASAKLTAYLLKKYSIPLDHDHIVAHGTIPAPFLATGISPNHVDPGPYWLWDYYLNLIHKQGVALPKAKTNKNIISLHPRTDRKPFGGNGTETPANFNFTYLYNDASTASGLIPQEGNGTDVTDETNNVEPDISYYVLDRKRDPAGSGKTMVKIWYGEEDQAHSSSDPTVRFFAHATAAWLAIPYGAASEGTGTPVTVNAITNPANIYGRPVSSNTYIIGSAPVGAIFVSAFSVTEAGATPVLWYEINFNHRQAWIPASEVTVAHH